MLVVIAVLLTAPVAPAAEEAWPRNSASDLSIFVTLLGFQIRADHCSTEIPRLKPQFAGLMEDLGSRVRGISKGLLASDVFKGMQDKPVPAPIIDAFKDSFHDAKHNLERRDAASVCPTTLQDLGDVDDEMLESGLTETLKAVQNMMRNLERESARQASPDQSRQRAASLSTRAGVGYASEQANGAVPGTKPGAPAGRIR